VVDPIETTFRIAGVGLTLVGAASLAAPRFMGGVVGRFQASFGRSVRVPASGAIRWVGFVQLITGFGFLIGNVHAR